MCSGVFGVMCFVARTGGVARRALQSLEQLKLIEKTGDGGRRLTVRGRRIKLVFHSSTIVMMHGPINIRITKCMLHGSRSSPVYPQYIGCVPTTSHDIQSTKQEESSLSVFYCLQSNLPYRRKRTIHCRCLDNSVLLYFSCFLHVAGKLAFWKLNNFITPNPVVLFAFRDRQAMRLSYMSLVVAVNCAAIWDGYGRVVKSPLCLVIPVHIEFCTFIG